MLTDAEKEANFFKFQKFAIVGASTNDDDWGGKIFEQFKACGKDVTPINPNYTEIDSTSCLKSVKDLPDPQHTAIVVITQPKVTLSILQDALAVHIPMIWIQPGAADKDGIAFLSENALLDTALWSAATSTTEGIDVVGPCVFTVLANLTNVASNAIQGLTEDAGKALRAT